ncbi:hypothetical protein QZH41_012223 [Actinostola sp. cb2023]|nr:hypothetical protein QZH41_012223 [Actinostola sp. cb2023]
MQFLRSNGFPCPEIYAIKDDKDHMALVDVSGLNPKTNEDDNKELCVDFTHAGLKSRTSNNFKWDILEFLNFDKYIGCFEEGEESRLMRNVHAAFVTNVKPHLQEFRFGTVHNDLNGENILVTSPPYVVSGVFDFGDMVESVIISDLVNSMVYFMEGDRGMEFSGVLMAGYQSTFPLPAQERKLLYYFVTARLCQLVMYCQSNLQDDPNHIEVQTSFKKYYGILRRVWRQTKDEVERIWSESESKMISLVY